VNILSQKALKVKLTFLGFQERAKVNADDSTQGGSCQITGNLYKTSGDEGNANKEIDDQCHQDDEECRHQAFQKTVFLRGITREDSEDEEENQAGDEGNGIEGGDLAVGFVEEDQQRINAGKDGKNKDETEIDKQFAFDFGFHFIT
jgi:hypothetical protein